jgi:hypothetical protein
MKRLALLLLLLPLASSALFAQTITPTSLPNGTTGVAYSQSVSLTPATQAAWAITVGALPPGLTLGPSGGTSTTISGTPYVVGTYSFTVQATFGLTAVFHATQAYTVVISAPSVYIIPSSVPNGTFGATYLQVLTASGGYGAGTYTFSLDAAGGPLPPGLVLSPTGLISGTPVALGTFSFIVRAASQTASGASVSGSQSYSITIASAPPAIATTSLPAGTVGVLYSQNLAATGGSPPYTWQQTGGSLPGGVTLSASGNLSGTPAAAGSFTFQVRVSDSQQASATGSFTIRIVPAALVITTSSLPAGTVGTSYTATLAATGGTPPYTWSVASGALPSGLSISSAGLISGTPTASGTSSATLQVTDSAQATATKAYSVTVAAATVPLSITTQSPLPSGVAGASYTQTFAATGGTQPYAWSLSAGTVPTGLTLNAATGSLTGTLTAAGTFNFTLQVTDSAKATATKAFTITVNAAVKITAATPPSGVTGASYTQQFAATGGVAPYVWSIASGSIPAGLSLSTATGLLSGTPSTPGTYTFTIGVTDQNGQKDSAAFSIAIVAPLSITTQASLPGGVAGVAYTQTFAATGGSPPYQWSVSTGSLPTGLTLSSAAGSLTGTPTAAGTFNFTLQAADAAGRNTTASFTITVTAALTITTATLPNGTVGTAYSQPLVAAGGNGTLTWSISTGTLPGGITLNASAGSLGGTPTAPGAFTFTVSVTGGGQTAAKSFTITVGVPPGPPATITGLPATVSPATQPVLGISLGSPYPLDISGQVTLTFVPEPGLPDDPAVQFTTGGRTASFQVPVTSSSLQAVFTGGAPGVQTGTVAGTITLTVKLFAGGVDVTPSPAPSSTTRIARSAPVIRSATVTRTTGGFNLVVVGYTTSRELVSAAITFTPVAGVTLSSSQATVQLTQVFTTWYADPTSAPYGSNFLLTMPFTVANGANPLTSVSVVLTNAQGSSNSMSATY